MKYFYFPSENSPLARIILLETDPVFLENLSYEEEWDIRYLVARNPNTPIETLTRLANDEDFCVRYSVAMNPNTSPETLERLSNDEYGDVREAVAKNPNTPTHIKKYLNEMEQMRLLKEVTNPETLDSVTFLQWLDVAGVEALESFGREEIV